jgi:hypothetical protein
VSWFVQLNFPHVQVLRGTDGSSFARCPVCLQMVLISTLTADHLDSPACRSASQGLPSVASEARSLSPTAAPHSGPFSPGRGLNANELNASLPRSSFPARGPLTRIQPEGAGLREDSAGELGDARDAPAAHPAGQQGAAPQPSSTAAAGPRAHAGTRGAVEDALDALRRGDSEGDDDAGGAECDGADGGALDLAGRSLAAHAVPEVPGLQQFHGFVTEAEERELLAWLDSAAAPPWRASRFNGRCDSKGWGMRTVRPPPAPPLPRSRTKWTRRVPHPVLIGHAASLTPY